MSATRTDAPRMARPGAPSRRPITICHFIPQLAIGGAELQLLSLATALRRSGFGVIVATLDDRHGFASRLRSDGVEVVILPRRWPFGLDTIVALARLVRGRRVSLIHAWLWSANWRAAVAKLFAPRVPIVVSIRSLEDDLTSVHLWLYRLLSFLTSRVVVNSLAVLERSAARTRIPRRKYRVVPNALDAARLESDASEQVFDDAIRSPFPAAIYVGTLDPRKRVASLARIAASIRRRREEFRLLVIGDGPERARLEAGCAEEGVSDRVYLAGYRDKVAPWLRAATVLVHPSKNEGCCNAILEAMGLGIAVVAYRVGGNPEIVSDGVTGYLVEDGDESAMADRVAEILNRPDLARRLGEAGRERVLREFSVDAMVRGMVGVYSEVLEVDGDDRASAVRG